MCVYAVMFQRDKAICYNTLIIMNRRGRAHIIDGLGIEWEEEHDARRGGIIIVILALMHG